MVTNVNAAVERTLPQAGADNSGYRWGFLDSAAKAAQNDTVTITNAADVKWAILTVDADGTPESVTLSANVITLTDSTTGAVSGLVYYKP